MEYGKIIAVTGLPGLFELLSSKNDGAIVRSLEDKNTKFVSSRIHNFSHLETIEVFTVRDNVNLAEIFQAMEKEGNTLPDEKDGAGLKKYFQTVYPDLDFEKVYASDLKKMVKWFGILKKNEVEIKLSQPEPEDPDQEAAITAETPATDGKATNEKAAAKKVKTAKAADQEQEAAAPKKGAAKTKAAAPVNQSDDDTEAAAPKKTAVKAKSAPKSEKAKTNDEKEEQPAKKAAPKKAAPKKK